MKHNLVLLWTVMLAVAALLPRVEGDETYSQIDRHALAAAQNEEESVAKLASYLARPCKTDIEKTRAVYRWVTDRIAYDFDAFRRGSKRNDPPATVLSTRKAVCEGYASLFADLCGRMGLAVAKVSGFGKGFGYHSGRTFTRMNHSWNAVQIDGKWRLIDSTWGAGSIQQGKFVKRFSEFFFLTPPDKLIFTHYPEEDRWQLLDTPVTHQQFEQQPRVSQELFELGVSVKDLRNAMGEEAFRDFVKTYSHPGVNTSIISAPVALYLRSGTQYSFDLKSADYSKITLISGGKWQPFQQDGNAFRYTGALPRGPVKIAGMLKEGDSRYHTFLEYFVR